MRWFRRDTVARDSLKVKEGATSQSLTLSTT
jgi:hypothetical protein